MSIRPNIVFTDWVEELRLQLTRNQSQIFNLTKLVGTLFYTNKDRSKSWIYDVLKTNWTVLSLTSRLKTVDLLYQNFESPGSCWDLSEQLLEAPQAELQLFTDLFVYYDINNIDQLYRMYEKHAARAEVIFSTR